MAPFPHWLTITLAIIGISIGLYKAPLLAQTIIGHEIQNSGSGIGQRIENSGSGIGGEVSVSVPVGTSAIGTRVIQNGPGTGLQVIQNGPGVGFRSSVTVGPSSTK